MSSLSAACAVRIAAAATAAVLGCSLLAQGGLPPVPVPPGNPITPQKAILGKLLFWEEQLSANNRMACGTCHRPEAGGADPRRQVNPGPDGVVPSPDDTFGSPGVIASDSTNAYQPQPFFNLREQVTPRTAPSSLTGAWFPENFWDGRASPTFIDPQTGLVSLGGGASLESQSVGPPVSSVEMAHDLRNWGQITTKLQNAKPMALATNVPPDMAAAVAVAGNYPALFNAAFGDSAITADRIARAIATYERTLVPDQTPWDLFQQGNLNALTPQQQGGLNLFNGPARCNICHATNLFSDRGFHNLGLRRVADDIGRQAVTNNVADRGRFKTPSLRNVGLRGNLMHTGQFTSVQQIVGFYNGGGGPVLDNKDPLLLPLGLPPQALNSLADFVQNGLTDPRVANRLPPFDRPTLASERVPPQGFQYGLATPGSGNRIPDVLAEVPANIGNTEYKVGMGNGLGAAAAVLLLSSASVPPGTTFLGANVNVSLPEVQPYVVALGGAIGVPGAGFATVQQALPDAPWLVGVTMFVQWAVIDAGGPQGVASSRGAELRFF